MARNSETLPFSLLAVRLPRSRCKRLEQGLATDGQAKGRPGARINTAVSIPRLLHRQGVPQLRKQGSQRAQCTPRNQPRPCCHLRPGSLPARLTPLPNPATRTATRTASASCCSWPANPQGCECHSAQHSRCLINSCLLFKSY